MAYNKQNFENGHILTAEDLNHMENGIEAAHEAIDDDDFDVVEKAIGPVTAYLVIQKDGVKYEIPVLRSDSGQEGEHELRYRHIPSATAYKKGAVIVDDKMSDKSNNPVQNKIVKNYIDNIVDEDIAKKIDALIEEGLDGGIENILRGKVVGDPPTRRIVLDNDDADAEIPLLLNGIIRALQLPDATEDTKGAMLPEDKVNLNKLAARPSLIEFFDEERSNVLYWNGETAGLECYKSGYSEFYKVSDITPLYGNLQDYPIKATYKTRPSSAPSTSVLSVIGDDAEGYCALGTVSSGPSGNQVYAYVVYEGNSLGISKGTYLNKGYEVSALDVGHPVYEKKVIKEDCLPDKVVESTNQVQNMLKFSGGDILNWDGKTQGLEVVDANFYRVSAAMPTFEELLKVYSASSFIKSIYDWNRYTNLVVNDYRDTEGYCNIDTSGLADDHTLCRVYYNGNAAEVTPGTYFYADETIYVDELVLEGYGKFVPVLKEECLPKGGVEAGTYGGLDTEAGAYNIPNVTVDEYGRITEASNSVLPKASAESDGYIGADDYKKIGYVPSIKCTGTVVISAGAVKANNYFTYYKTVDEGVSDFEIPPVFYMVGEYTDAKGNTHKIPVKWDAVKTVGTDKSGNPMVSYTVWATIENPVDYVIYVSAWSNYRFYCYM